MTNAVVVVVVDIVIATIPKEEEEEIATKTAGRTTLEGRVDDVTEPLMS